MKFAESTKLHRKSGMGPTQRLVAGTDSATGLRESE